MSTPKDFILHAIGHGHIDPTWLWRWTEGYEEVRATFHSALARMDETPEFKFTASSACFYQWVKESDPALFEAVRARVKEGRWEIAGGMWVEPDCNLPSGEAFVRHGLYSQRFFSREFGQRATVGFNPDSFGHAGTLPQILKKLGIDNYIYMRPQPVVEMDYPEGTTFWWESPDGSRVLTVNLPQTYNAVGQELRDRIRALPHYPHFNPGQHRSLCFFGVGNHGGGPTKEAIQMLQAANAAASLPSVVFSTLQEFLSAIRQDIPADQLPVISEELQHHARGCYSVHSEIKRLNREVEHALMTAERFSTAAWLLGVLPYPTGEFELSWQDLLYNQFHDILAGTSLQASYQDTRDQLGAARHRADAFRNMAIQAIAHETDTTAEGNTIIVINPLAWPVECPVVAPPSAARSLETPLHLVDNEGQPVPLQAVRGERIDHKRHAFLAHLPAMGYSMYHLRSGGAEPARPAHPLEATRTHLENAWWRIDFDPRTGEITELVDKTRRTHVLRRGNVLAALVDHSDTWSHGVDEWRVEAGRFDHARLDVVEHGDVLATVRSVSTYGKSTAILETTVYRDSDLIDCLLRVNWQERYTLLKLVWETNIKDGEATYEAPYGHAVRPATGGEEPGQQWFDWSGAVHEHPCGLSVLNDSKYGFDVRDGVMRMTILRSPAYAHHDNGRFNANDCWPIMDQGWQEVRFRLLPHGGDWREARTAKRAWELNVPAFAHCESAHPGKRPTQASLLGTESDNVLLSVIKQSEEGEDIIIRGYEIHGQPAATRLHLPFFDRSFDLTFAPHEIKTVRINPRTWEVAEVNLLEE